jgi:rod shape determining protein RodA
MSRANYSLTKEMDWTMFALYLVMVLLGVGNIYSASFNEDAPFLFDFSQNYGKQILWFGISLFLGFIIFLLDSEFIRKSTTIIYGIVLLMLILVLFTPPINGARSWFGIGGFGIQPSEFAKISTALALSFYVSKVNIKLQDKRSVIVSNLLLLVPMILVAMQPDAGTLVVFTAFLFVLYREGITYDPLIVYLINAFPGVRIKRTLIGSNFIPILFVIVFLSVVTLLINENEVMIPFTYIPLKGSEIILFTLTILTLIFVLLVQRFIQKRERSKLVALGIVSAILLGALVFFVDFAFNKLKEHQKDRIELVLGLKEDPHGKDYNRHRAMSAVGSGGFSGKGFKEATLASPQSKHVPEQETDFIFCTLSEEWGFIGSVVIVVLFMTFLIKTILIAERQRSVYNRIYAYSVAMIFFYHFAINIGMNIGLVPVIGIPLPFFSYGGSSLLSFSIMVFLLLKLDSERKEVLR